LAQAPIFFALFTVLNGIGKNPPVAHGVLTQQDVVNAAQAKFFGAPISQTFLGSTSGTVKLVTVILIAFMSLTTFTTQRQLMVKGMPKMDSSNNMMLQQQKIMLYLFPVIFAVSGVNFPIGVLIYWSTTNLWTWGQQFYVIKRNPTPGSPAFEELQRKRANKNPNTTNPNSGVSLNGDAEGSVIDPEIKGQRQQPNKKKKKKK